MKSCWLVAQLVGVWHFDVSVVATWTNDMIPWLSDFRGAELCFFGVPHSVSLGICVCFAGGNFRNSMVGKYSDSMETHSKIF